MKTIIKVLIPLVVLSLMAGCRAYSYEEMGSRNIEPQHNVVTVPIVADVELLSQEKITYTESFYCSKADLGNVDSFKYVALAHAVKQYEADLMIGAMFGVKYIKKGRHLEVTVTGFPAKYKELREATPDDQWFLNNKIQ